MPHRLPRPARLAITLAKLAVLGSIIAIGLFGTGPTTSAGPAPGYVVQPVDDRPTRADRLLDEHACSTTGFDTDRQPQSAIVQTRSGALRFVDFDTGWRVYTQRGAALLVAVCLGEPPG
jgi:hypothetical protein